MTEYSRMAKGNFTAASGQATAVVNLPFVPDYVELWNYTNIKTLAANTVFRAWWDVNLVDGSNNPTMTEIYNNSSVTVFDTIQTGGVSTFQGALGQQYGATKQIIGITKASQAVVNVTAHGYNVGDTVIMQGIALATTNNMQLLNGVPFTIVAITDANHFTIQWDTSGSNYTAISGSPSGTLVKKVLYPFLYLPEDNVVSVITTGSTTTIKTTMYHNFEPGQEIAFRIPPFWGTTQLNSLPNNVIPGSPVYGYVTSVTDNWTFVCTINSSGFTAFTDNGTMTASTLVGLTYPQVLAVGDVNTGGIINGLSVTNLYPSPQFPTSTNRVSTINGPAIRGAFVNNTSQGFIIGAGIGNTDSNANTAILTPSQANVIYWHAYLHDYANP
jgi:hypothetical protein